jgi:hypothetical protein
MEDDPRLSPPPHTLTLIPKETHECRGSASDRRCMRILMRVVGMEVFKAARTLRTALDVLARWRVTVTFYVSMARLASASAPSTLAKPSIQPYSPTVNVPSTSSTAPMCLLLSSARMTSRSPSQVPNIAPGFPSSSLSPTIASSTRYAPSPQSCLTIPSYHATGEVLCHHLHRALYRVFYQ